jgi:nucleoside-diphosphate kinase
MKSIQNYILEQLTIKPDIVGFTIIKPGFINYENEINEYITEKGFVMNDHTSPHKISLKQAQELYKVHKDKEFYDDLCEYMTSNDIIAATWCLDKDKYKGVNPIQLMKDVKHHFRDKYGKTEMENCMHSSDSLKDVKREAQIIMK